MANMTSLPNEICSVVTGFLPINDITDLMLLSKNFNVLVTPRLKNIDEEMAIMNQSIKSFMPLSEPHYLENKWISQLNLRQFEPIGSEAKKQMKETFENEEDLLNWMSNKQLGMLGTLKKRMSLERFDDRTFLCVLCVLVAMPKNPIVLKAYKIFPFKFSV